MFYKLKIKDWLYLIVLIILIYLCIGYDQLILGVSYQRIVAFPLFGIIVMFIFFVPVKPEKPILLSNTMIIILMPLFIFLSIVLHIFIYKDGFQNKSILLWIMTIGMIYFTGFIYKLIFKK